MLDIINPAPKTKFILAIEELEAWLLGDILAIKKAYPKVKDNVLNSYSNDSICGTWEVLATALNHDVKKLKNGKYSEIGRLKKEWAEKITQHFDISQNKSPSFNNLIKELNSL